MKALINTAVFLVVMLLTPIIYASDRTIQLASTDWAPYSGAYLRKEGVLSDIVSTAFAQVGYKVKFIYRPWIRALEEAKKGKWHGVMDVYYKPDHLETIIYSDPIWTVQLAFFTLKENGMRYQKLSDLHPYKVGVVRGVEFEKELKAAGLKIEHVTNVEQNIKKVLAKRIHLGISAKANVRYKLQSYHSLAEQKQIQFLSPIFKQEKVYVNFSKFKPNYLQLAQDFNRGLQIIKEKGIYQAIIKYHGLSED